MLAPIPRTRAVTAQVNATQDDTVYFDGTYPPGRYIVRYVGGAWSEDQDTTWFVRKQSNLAPYAVLPDGSEVILGTEFESTEPATAIAFNRLTPDTPITLAVGGRVGIRIEDGGGPFHFNNRNTTPSLTFELVLQELDDMPVNNLTATTNPSAANGAPYTPGSLWINQASSPPTIWMMASNNPSNVWEALTGQQSDLIATSIVTANSASGYLAPVNFTIPDGTIGPDDIIEFAVDSIVSTSLTGFDVVPGPITLFNAASGYSYELLSTLNDMGLADPGNGVVSLTYLFRITKGTTTVQVSRTDGNGGVTSWAGPPFQSGGFDTSTGLTVSGSLELQGSNAGRSGNFAYSLKLIKG